MRNNNCDKIYRIEESTLTMSMEDNYHQHHQCATVQEAERHIDHNQEITTTIRQIIKETAIRIINITIEIQVIIETISIEVEQTATSETIVMIDITIVDKTQDTQTVVNQNTDNHITEIITTTKIIIIIITDKDSTAEIQIELTDTDKIQTATTDIFQTITIEPIEEIRHIENKTTNINQKTEEQMEKDITIITKKVE